MRKLFAMLLISVLFMIMSASLGSAEDWEALAALYAPVLDDYAAGLAGDEAALEAREGVGHAYRCASYGEGDPLEKTGYAYLDLNGDGSPELVIGEICADEQTSPLIFEILTLRDGQPATVLLGWERFRVSLTHDTRSDRWGYYAEGSSSAFNSVYQSGWASPDMDPWDDVRTLEANSDFSGDRIHWTLDGREITPRQADDLTAAWRKDAYEPLLCSFAERENRRNTGFVDERTPRRAGGYCRTFRARPDGPVFDLVIAGAGEENAPEAWYENVLSVEIAPRDGGAARQFTYDSAETPGSETAGILAWLEDMNFDGYDDLVLCTARGAYNEFCVFCLWDPEAGCFAPVTVHCPWRVESERFEADAVPLEVCNYSLRRTDHPYGVVYSYEKDGYAYRTVREYVWESENFLRLQSVFDVYDAGEGHIGERLYRFGTQAEKAWDQTYPEDWYYGDTGAFEAREEAARAWLGGNAAVKRVANADWVNLREMDGKQSRSLARLNAGTEVTVLKEDCADGWTLVLWDTGEAREGWVGPKTVTGYIWHSFLE